MKSLLSQLRGCLVFTGYFINTLFWAAPLLVISLFKLLPIKALRHLCSGILDQLASGWISTNSLMERCFHPVKLTVTGDTELARHQWYMVVANHQSWVDILILQRLFNRNIPFLKFFLKQELIYVPVLGLAWWALDFPFMRRYSTAQLKKDPKLRGKDIEITRKACAKFKHQPVSVMNFVEGTRFTSAKHGKQNSPYQHLLRPKAGGMAFALSAMTEIDKLVDVTICYCNGVPSFWDYICGRGGEIRVNIKLRDIDDAMRGDYQNDKAFKKSFQQQLNQIWQHKDQVLGQLKAG
ncbi:acyltransferase [Shewanella sp. NFH-SH190041]|uniref:acyltransferase n=1 Tax=Shewanella sp. NFH-SH190041 TaxID=2950245 RepID=UPI0021C33570|nr:acyltransferase [Shewanella sp. NFH-SH190041]BDM65990.1 acyltransferase [Shewanella sp. NFH-SH190041]